MITRNIASLEEQLAVVNAALVAAKKKPLNPKEEKDFTERYTNALSHIELYIPRIRDEKREFIKDEKGNFVYDETRSVVVNVPLMHDGGGYQIIAHGDVNDTAITPRNEYNWHLSNTSQWLFGFGLVFDKERRDLSMHT